MRHSQRNIVGDSLGLYEVFGLVLSDYVPADAIVDAVLQQHSPVNCVSLIQSYVTAVCLCYATNLQHKHDLTGGRQRRKQEERRKHEKLVIDILIIIGVHLH